ncbi:FadR/GntR family transcriptional regulator [Streptosporangium roseum]|uniref:GntR family transcriptional regulator n=1 Tax=Streptosporangium roseum (strain ATCC 12428 / DSM 43021 / JCM 3005 / KCTC 9067 / NCIMB 10171 / NRRL 2505 / NI 9100) TaxID=479432 RepID=D2B529_STRRD|nr:FCD domain-containing protein [Streptosporangium roseum]ACZ87553.1 GntR family transcriptional regulator [Streptosporangium roseum DSM 43021]
MTDAVSLPPKVSRAEVLVREIEGRILSGEWAQGDRLGTRADLRVKYGVAAATVSETVRMLEARGLVEARPGNGGGIFVSEPAAFVRLGHKVLELHSEPITVADCLAVRDRLDPMVVVEAARHRTDSDIAELNALLQKLLRSQDDPNTYLAANWALHRRLAEVSPNLVLRHLYLSLLDFIESQVNMVVPDGDFGGAEARETHTAIVEAVCVGDVEAARQAGERHVRLTSR